MFPFGSPWDPHVGWLPDRRRALDDDVWRLVAARTRASPPDDAFRLGGESAQKLEERLGVEQVERIRLAGAFGSHIDVKYATVLGMIPDCDLQFVDSAGNAAGTGARIALLDATSRATIEQLVRNVEKVETAIEPRFQEHFVEAMAIPHKTASYPNLSKVVTLPATKPSASQNETRGRRPRRTEAPAAT